MTAGPSVASGTGCPVAHQDYPFAWPDGLGQPDALLDAHRTPFLEVRLPSGDTATVLTRYRDIRAVLADPRVSKNRNRPDVARMTAGSRKVFASQVDMDPPAHTRMRRLIAKAFTATAVERCRPMVRAAVDELLGGMIAGGDTADLNTAFSFPLSIRVICELLGVPESERAQFGEIDRPPWEYMESLIERKRADPGDDLVSSLIAVSDAQDGRLSAEELRWWSTLLLLAGYETTANQISGAVVLLQSDRAQWSAVARDPALIESAVEELLRHQVVGTSLSMLRYVTEDIVVGGQRIPRGSSIIPSLECANHDPEVFDHPEVLDVTRDGAPQVTFSTGQHFCVGAPLARVELQEALRGILARLPHLRLTVPVSDLDRVQDVFFQGFQEVPITW